MSDADGWLELTYDCDAFTPVAVSEVERRIVREYANRIVLGASAENRLDSLKTIVEVYDEPSGVVLEEAVVSHLCTDGRIASRLELDSALTPRPGRKAPPISPEADSIRRANPSLVLRSGDEAPNFIAPLLDSAYLADTPEHLQLSDLRGNWVVLDFWATWCGPCIAIHPGMVALADRYAERDVIVLGVLHRDFPSEALAYMERDLGSAYQTVVDEGSRVSALYNVWGIPQLILIDPAGMVAAQGYHAGTMIEYLEARLSVRGP
ncbi:MAG: TlpA disulfide reductase family protein [Vicinamibacterales bacterium]